jgi:hypothetical protein
MMVKKRLNTIKVVSAPQHLKDELKKDIEKYLEEL